MIKYEYIEIEYNRQWENYLTKINEKGKEGWEVISIVKDDTSVVVLYKRIKNES